MSVSPFFFNDTATTEIYTLSLHDALPIFKQGSGLRPVLQASLKRYSKNYIPLPLHQSATAEPDRKSTRLNSSHANISYAVFCLKKKNERNRLRAVLSMLARQGVATASVDT